MMFLTDINPSQLFDTRYPADPEPECPRCERVVCECQDDEDAAA